MLNWSSTILNVYGLHLFGWQMIENVTVINQKSSSQQQVNQKLTKFEVEISTLKNGWSKIEVWF